MRRTQIYLTEKEQQFLKRMSKNENKPKSEIIRQAIDEYIKKHRTSSDPASIIKKAKGIWKKRDDLPDFQRLRDEWDRQ